MSDRSAVSLLSVVFGDFLVFGWFVLSVFTVLISLYLLSRHREIKPLFDTDHVIGILGGIVLPLNVFPRRPSFRERRAALSQKTATSVHARRRSLTGVDVS